MKKNRTITVVILVVLAVLIPIVPLFMLKGAKFGGSDGAGSNMVIEVTGGTYTPWFTPVMERVIGGELPPEMETFFFCIQTGIGVGIIAYAFGYLAARKKYGAGKPEQDIKTGVNTTVRGA